MHPQRSIQQARVQHGSEWGACGLARAGAPVSAAHTCSSNDCRPRPGLTAGCAKPVGLTSSSTASRLESSVGKARVLGGDGIWGASGDRATEGRRRQRRLRRRRRRGGEASQPFRPPLGPRRRARSHPQLAFPLRGHPDEPACSAWAAQRAVWKQIYCCTQRSADRFASSLAPQRRQRSGNMAAEAAAAGCADSCWKLAFGISTL